MLLIVNDPHATADDLLRHADNLQGPQRLVALTQAARAFGESDNPARAHEILDQVAAEQSTDLEVIARVALERAWLVVDEADATAVDRAADLAREAAGATASHLDQTPLGGLHVEALRLRARCADTTDERIASLRKAISLAESAKDPDARAWRARLLIDLARVDQEADKLGYARQRLNEAVVVATEVNDVAARDEASRLLALVEIEVMEREKAVDDPTVVRPRFERPDEDSAHAPRRGLPID